MTDGCSENLFCDLTDLLENSKKLAIAVSGGSDSMALMLLVADWARRNDRTDDICVLSVNHNLRSEADEEAKQVCDWAAALGLQSQTLTWQHDELKTAIQERARAGRYKLISQWCKAHNFDGVVTAHTCDDQAETLLMRLARGSGVDGLAAMRPCSNIFGLKVFRPLLDVSKKDLRAILTKADHGWIEDPSNVNEKFERIKVRNLLPVLEEAGIKAGSLRLSARRLMRASVALDEVTDRFMGEMVKVFNTGHCEVDKEKFFKAPEEIAIRKLTRLIGWASGNDVPVQMAKVERLFDLLLANPADKCTLGGAQIVVRKKSILIGREFGRIGSELSQKLDAGQKVWDNRFVFSERLDVYPYGLIIDKDDRPRPHQIPHFVACCLPVFDDKNGKPIVPHFDSLQEKQVNLLALPIGISATSPLDFEIDG